jgi:hypothetical protein
MSFMRLHSFSFAAVWILMGAAGDAQTPASGPIIPPKEPSHPAPHLTNGRVDFAGVWRPADIFLIEDISLGLKKGDTISLTAAAEEIMKKHLSKDDPETNCLPTGVPRQAPLPVEDRRITALHLLPV